MLNVSLRIIRKLSCIITMEFPVSGAVIYAEQPRVSSNYDLSQSAQHGKCLKKCSKVYTFSFI